MKYNEFTRVLIGSVTKPDLESILRKNGFDQFKYHGNKLQVLVQIPESHLMVWILRNDSDRNSASMESPVYVH